MRLANIIASGDVAGDGAVHSFGFQYGYSYSRRTMPIVPPRYGKSEMHPVVLLRSTPVEQAIGRAPHALIAPTKGVEVARFGNRAVVVNHRSSPINLRDVPTISRIALDLTREGYVAAHSAVYLELDPTAIRGTRGAGPAEVEQ